MVGLGFRMNTFESFSKRGGFPSSPKFGEFWGFQELELAWKILIKGNHFLVKHGFE